MAEQSGIRALTTVFALVVSTACASPQAHAAGDSCPVLTSLRSMAADHFRKQRGKALREDTFATDYRIPGAHECTITANGPNDTELSCHWYLQRNLSGEPSARAEFLETVANFQACLKDPLGIDIRKHNDGRGASVDLSDRFDGARAGSEYAVHINYLWSAPWWYLYVEYRRSDP